MTKYLVIGATFIDVNTFITKDMDDLSFQTNYNIGGKGFNIAKGLALFKNKVVFHTCLGKDDFGIKVCKDANKFDLKITENSFIENFNTPICSIILSPSGQTIFEKVDTTVFTKFPLLTLSMNNVREIIIFSHLPETILEQVFSLKKYQYIRIYLSISGSKDIPNILKFLPGVDVIFANKKETGVLLDLTQSKTEIDFIEKYNITEFISTKDIDGAEIFYKKSDKFVSKIVPNYIGYTDSIVNTVGAGDALVSSYIHFRNTSQPELSLEKALQICAAHIRNKYSSLNNI